LEEIGYRNGWLPEEALQRQATALAKTGYGQYLQQVLDAETTP
jgi:glucose-1-phosphate thymidylyltransferase